MSGTITGTLSHTLQTRPPYPGFPTYANSQLEGYAFDWARNRYYNNIASGGKGGIATTDMTTMTVTSVVGLDQMYAGTPFGSPPGTPWDQSIWDITCGSGIGTDIYILTSAVPGQPTIEWTRFNRVDATTMKITGEWYISNNFPPPYNSVFTPGQSGGVVNTTTSHTIVAYLINGGPAGVMILDGTGMAQIGFGPTPAHGNNYLFNICISGGTHPDGSCDFIMLNSDNGGHSGHVDIWRINVSNSLTITNTKTGTVNTASVMPVTSNLFIPQANYAVVNNTIILWLSNSPVPGAAPYWVLSVNFDGTINWSNGYSTDNVPSFGRGQSLLTGSTLMVGLGGDLRILDITTGAQLFAGSAGVAQSFLTAYDSSGMRRFGWDNLVEDSRIDFVGDYITLTDAELLFEPLNTFYDFANEGVRRAFISPEGTPAWMGSHGALPFGTSPAVYLTTLGPPLDFTQNNGPGGGFPVSGTIGPAAGPGCSNYYVTEASTPVSRPQWRLTVSDDGSRTWSRLVKPRDIGATGQYKTRLRWLKMGQFRQRVIKLECTDPVRRNIIGIYIDNTQGSP